MKFSVIELSPALPEIFKGGRLQVIFPVNAQLVGLANQRDDFRQALKVGTCVVDGQILQWAVNIRAFFKGTRSYQKLSGSDLVYRISSEVARNQGRLLLIGGSEHSNTGSVQRLKELYGGEVFGFSPEFSGYPMSREWLARLFEVIDEVKPTAIFFGLGAPKQELLIKDIFVELESRGVSLVMAVGGSFDFVSGNIKRAPKFIQKIGMEGVYRLCQQPSRMRAERLAESFMALRFFVK
ncbi:WecB/TagA/CpsF family glycosyltransferase [Massilia sp. UBA6681]|uniref:WecB/TagA/CpsF family glycosyltransferase n=1 Tax=Massilia sp. UBA6681 TaxID=1946839 RepID=UPI0025BBEBD3|nr:WecB/TagA/CpsF family glycosyltransferase [Massilia sp. UBA6681]